MRGCHLHLRSRPQRFCGRIHRGPVWTDPSLATGVNPSRPRESRAESARARPSPLTLARFSSWMISASTSSVASSSDCSAAAAGRENQASAARSGSEVTGTGPRPRPPGPARERAAHLPTAAAVPVPAPACLGSAAPRHPAPCRPPAPAADARRILRTDGPRPAAASGPDASAAAGTCLRRVLSAPPAATGAGRPAWPHAR